ncbi:MAG: TonB-dependent receptor [Methylococcaceae bacterium]|jgi:iron complex outermembrane receptor protein
MKNKEFFNKHQCLALLLLFSARCFADEKNIEDLFELSPAELGELPVVTIASGTPRTIAQSPAVTTVITAEQIKAMGARQLSEVLETVPGMHASVQQATYDTNYSVRGIRNEINAQLLFLLDGTRMNLPYRGGLATGLQIGIEAIQRVEIIRGPGSALYGADAFAGVINIVTKKAKDINGTNLGVRSGNFDRQSGWAQQSGNWAGWDIAANFQFQNAGLDSGQVISSDRQTGIDRAVGTRVSRAPGVVQAQFESINSFFNLQRKHWNINFSAMSGSDAGTNAGVNAVLDPNGRGGGEQYLADLRYSTEDDIENWELKAQLTYLYSELDASFQAFPNGAVLPVSATGDVSFSAPVAIVSFPDGANTTLGRVEQIPSLNLSSIYRGFDAHLLQLGFGYRYEQVRATNSSNFGRGAINAAALLPPPAVNVQNGTLTNFDNTQFAYLPPLQRSIGSLFLQDEWQLAKAWQVVAGARYDHYSDFGGTFNPRLALIWEVNDQLTSKILYGRAFRAPSFLEQANQNNPTLVGNRNLKPEIINTIELAFNYRPIPALRTGVNFYYYELNDGIQIVRSTSSQAFTFQNVGNQNGYGTEFEWNWQLDEQWSINGNYAWQNSRNDQTGQRIRGVPEHHVYAAAVWKFDRYWQLQSQLNWVGSRLNPVATNAPLADFESIDMTLSRKKLFNFLDLTGSVRNIFDEDIREPSVSDIVNNFPLPGRSFYFEASVHF